MNKKAISRIMRYVLKYKFYLLFGILSALISVALSLLVPVLVGDGVDLIIGKGNVDFSGLISLAVMLAAAILFSSVFSWIMSLCTNKVSYHTVMDIRNDAFKKIQRLPLKYIDSKSQGDIMARVVSDLDQVSDGLLQGFAQLFTGVVTIAGTLVFMLTVNPAITALVVILTPISLFVASFIAKRSYRMFKAQTRIRGRLSGIAEEIIGNKTVVKAFGYEQKAQDEFEAVNAKLYRYGVKSQFYSSLTNPCTRFVNSIVYAAVAAVGAVFAINGWLTVGGISCFLSYANQYTKPFNEISGVVTELQSAIACANRVFDIMDEKELSDESNKLSPKVCKGNVSIENLYFSYSPDKKLIENFNLNVKSGQKVAVVGPTGCGKTTLINLLMRFYEPDSGRIVIDGADSSEIKRESLRAMFGMVLQDTWLFTGTIKENIAYGKPEASDEEIIAAAKAAHAHSFIKKLPDGYDTLIAEDGGNISQGQKQLLCISRIMLLNPPMLILDEATSSIDTHTESRIQRAFDKMMKGKTSFIVAHRLSTIKEADIILVMRDGNVVEQGTHEELLKSGSFYSRLYYSQFDISST